jgi:cell division initiation protein
MRTRLTSLDVQRQLFTVRGKGFDREEVGVFLRQVGDELEALTQELAILERRVAELQAENGEHRQREAILKETLLTAQRAAEEVRGNARREAELIVREAEMMASRLGEQAQDRASAIEKEIDDLRFERRKFHAKLQNMIDLFQQTLEFDRERESQESRVVGLHRRGGESGESSGG